MILIKILIIIGLGVIIYFGLAVPFNDGSLVPDASLFAQYGDFIGGFVGTIFSLVAIFLLYKTLVAQQKASLHQKQNSELQIFETTFFNLLKSQNELTISIKAYFPELKNDFSIHFITISGREFFLHAFNFLVRINNSFTNEKYLEKFHDEDMTGLHYEMIDINSSYPPEEADQRIAKIMEEYRLRTINEFFHITKQDWERINKKSETVKIKEVYNAFFLRYHYAVGHYFRHLFHIIKFVDDFKQLNSEINVKKYIDIIQAQMSSYELALLFYNAHSFPKMFKYIKDYNFLENLAEDDLIHPSHNNIEGIHLKSRRELLGK